MLIHLINLPLVLLNDKVPLDLHGGGQLSGYEGEVLRRDYELVHLGGVGDGALVDLLDSCHDLRLHFWIVFRNELFDGVSFQTKPISPL